MPMYYLDIETTGVDPRRSEIVTIQFQQVGWGGKPKGPLHVLKAWESSEAAILTAFERDTDFFSMADPWAFFPTGFNLGFEYRFLLTRMERHGLTPNVPWDFALNKPDLDLKPIAVLMNGGKYRGASLENFSRKTTSGHSVIEALQTQDWPAVERYVEMETKAFFELLEALYHEMPGLWQNRLAPALQDGGTTTPENGSAATATASRATAPSTAPTRRPGHVRF